MSGVLSPLEAVTKAVTDTRLHNKWFPVDTLMNVIISTTKHRMEMQATNRAISIIFAANGWANDTGSNCDLSFTIYKQNYKLNVQNKPLNKVFYYILPALKDDW
jgi:hypothetical protein